MTGRAALDLAVILPDGVDGHDRCVDRLIGMVGGARGVSEAHVVDDGPVAMVCVHFDETSTSVARIRELVHAAGAELASRYGHAVWAVEGVGHARRARAVTAALRAVPGVLEAEVSIAGVARLEWDRRVVDDGRLIDTLRGVGVVRRPVESVPGRAGAPGGADRQVHGHTHDDGHDHAHVHDHGGAFGARTELVLAVAAGLMVVVGVVLSRWADGAGGAADAVYAAAAVTAGWSTVREAWGNVRRRRFEIDSLMVVAAIGAALLGEWFEAALLLVLFGLGHALEGYAMGRARHAIDTLAELTPDTARVRRGGDVVEVSASVVEVGDDVVVRPHERFPVDGFVVTGSTSVDQGPVTGESAPVDKVPVDDPAGAARAPDEVDDRSRIFAGSLNGSGAVDVRVTRLVADSTLARVARMVAEAETEVAPTQRLTERFERVFVPVVIVVAVAVAIVGPALVGWSWETGFYRSMAVLVAASPCALAIATPSAVLSGIARAARSRVLVKGGAALEQLGTVSVMAFDKTGTLTEGRARVTDVWVPDGGSEPELWSTAMAVETLSDHPLARAVRAEAAVRLDGAAAPLATDLVALPGRGVTATVGDTLVHIGNAELFAEVSGPPLPPELGSTVDDLLAAGRTAVIVRSGARYLGVIGVMDTPRPPARAVVQALRDQGIDHLVMLSGDAPAVAETIAADLGVDQAIGGLLPESKVDHVRALAARYGTIAMVGDGVNDAPALATATVGIVMGAAGSAVALETADVALMSDDLTTIPFVIRLSRATRRTIHQNLAVSLGVVALLVPLTIGGLDIGIAVSLHEGSTLVVVANALRLLRFDPHTRMAS